MNKSDEYSNLRRHTRHIFTDLYYDFNIIPTLRQTKPRERPEAAICVRKSSARRVLHFTPLIRASSVLHRPANRVIHRLQLYCIIFQSFRENRNFQSKCYIVCTNCGHQWPAMQALYLIIIESGGNNCCHSTAWLCLINRHSTDTD